jgi:hypothetical protein
VFLSFSTRQYGLGSLAGTPTTNLAVTDAGRPLGATYHATVSCNRLAGAGTAGQIIAASIDITQVNNAVELPRGTRASLSTGSDKTNRRPVLRTVVLTSWLVALDVGLCLLTGAADGRGR